MLKNVNCTIEDSPAACPRYSWQYLDENSEWNLDREIKVECGRCDRIEALKI